jgi:hypothetical protein
MVGYKEKGNVVAINGLDGYCLPKLIDRFEYARKDTPTKSFFKTACVDQDYLYLFSFSSQLLPE